MKLIEECVPCMVRQGLSAAVVTGMPMEKREGMIREILAFLAEKSWEVSPPGLAKDIYKIIESHTGIADPYKEIKHQYNTELLEMIDDLRGVISGAEDPFTAAVKLAVSGNIIDFGTHHTFSRDSILESVDKIEHTPLAHDDSGQLKEKLGRAGTLLYLGDNCGEIVFDRVFIEYLKEQFPDLKITFAVRGGPILNDVTRFDASETDLDKLVDIIDNGDRAPGTLLESCSRGFRKTFYTADIIISKGQGNFESLNSVNRGNVFFLFMAKCRPVARILNVPELSLICVKNSLLGSSTNKL